MRIVFMGTPGIAAHALQALLNAGHDVAGVYTRQDKPVGRKQILTAPPVKEVALRSGLPVFQPQTLRQAGIAAGLRALQPDLVVVVAYGRILPPEILAIPPRGCINLHVSMLPLYRGAAPVQWAIINGERCTGVTIMQMDEGLDTGPILTQKAVDVFPDDTAADLFDRVTDIGAGLLCKTVDLLEEGVLEPKTQTGEPSTAPMLTKAMAEIDFAQPAAQLHNLVRGCNPWPMAWFMAGGKRVKLVRATPVDAAGAPGTVLGLSPLVVGCGQGALQLDLVRPEGSREMTGAEWAAGRRFQVGTGIQGGADI